MNKIYLYIVILVTLLSFFAQKIRAQKETEYKKSVFQHNLESDYFYCLPLNYNKIVNELRQYPLVIYLHGGGGYGKICSLDYLGYSNGSSIQDSIAKFFQLNYPSFILVPQSKGGWDASKVIPLIEDFKSKYPIDNKRIYLIGYSMGGSESYILANSYYDYNQTLFAGIIRLAGQSQITLREPIAFNTSIWMQVGLEDVPKRIEVTREAYNFLRMKNSGATESSEKIKIWEVPCTTKSLKINNSTTIKKTEYEKTGHGIYRFPFNDKRVISWLFEQKLKL